MNSKKTWWESIPLEEMTREQWEQLCDRCGKCCLIKLEDEENGTVYYTDIICRYIDDKTCSCKEYQNRRELVPECVELNRDNLHAINWMPLSCSYRLLNEGKSLPDWHHLVSADKDTIHKQKQSVKGRYVLEGKHLTESDYEDHIVEWPIQPIH